jgi:hypothetical protein
MVLLCLAFIREVNNQLAVEADATIQWGERIRALLHSPLWSIGSRGCELAPVAWTPAIKRLLQAPLCCATQYRP